MKAWMRVLTVTLSNKNNPTKKLIIGDRQDNLSVDISGSKYMSSLKDSCSIKISNLTYSEIVQIIDNKYFEVEIVAGYKNGPIQTIFKGGVLYISNSLSSDKTNTAIILCASSLIARYNQSRLNLSLNSGINLYSAIKYAGRKAGLLTDEMNTSEYLKTIGLLEESKNVTGTLAQWIQSISDSRPDLIVDTDESLGGKTKLSMFVASRSNGRTIRLTSNMIDLNGGFPQLSSDGLVLTVSPTYSFKCGDTIIIDNTWINSAIESASQISSNPGNFFDRHGAYMIYSIKYMLSNRSSQFSMVIQAKKRGLISDYIGGSHNG